MVRKTLANTGASLFLFLSTMSLHLRHGRRLPKTFHLVLLLSYTLLAFTLSEPCPETGMNYPAEYITCRSHIDNPSSGFEDTVGDASSNHKPQSSETTHQSINGGSNTCLSCFLSPLGISGSQSNTFFYVEPYNNLSKSWGETNWLSDYGMFELHNGRKLSCTLNTEEGLSLSYENYVSSCGAPILRSTDINVSSCGVPQIDFLCQDVLHICLRNQKFYSPWFEENVHSTKKKTGSLSNNLHISSQFKVVDVVEPDKLSLRNWKSQGSTFSVLDEHEVFFPLVEIGTYHSKWITVKNPSQEPVMMQLILNTGEIIDQCNLQNNLFPLSSLSSSGKDKLSGLKEHGFSIAEYAVTEAVVHPQTEATLGPINFHPSDRCRWRRSALIRNSFSGVELLSLTGLGGSLSLTLLEGSKPVQSINFFPTLPIPLNISLFGAFFHIEETASTCSQPLSKELFAKNTGDLPLEVKTVRISGSRCKLDGFTVHPCNGFSLQPEESTRLQVSYQADFSTYRVLRELELVLASGILVVPLKSSMLIPMHTLCKRSVFWARLKNFFMAILLAASLMFLLLHCGLFHDHQFSEDSFCITAEFDYLLRSIGEDMRGKSENVEENDGFKDSSISAIEVSEPAHNKLSVKTGNGKKKNRKKKKKGTVSGLMNSVEFSSSQSGNSTPTSPISPLLDSPVPELSGKTRNQIAVTDPPSKPASSLNIAEPKVPVIQKPDPSQETGNPFVRSALPSKQQDSIHKHSEPNFGFVSFPQQQISKPVLSVSATFPSRTVSAGTTFGSPLAPHARAPGSKLLDQKPAKDGEMQTGNAKNELRYDIWGDHLSVLRLMDRFKNVSEGKNVGVDDDESVSFFSKDPQMLFSSHPKYASLFDPKEE